MTLKRFIMSYKKNSKERNFKELLAMLPLYYACQKNNNDIAIKIVRKGQLFVCQKSIRLRHQTLLRKKNFQKRFILLHFTNRNEEEAFLCRLFSNAKQKN